MIGDVVTGFEGAVHAGSIPVVRTSRSLFSPYEWFGRADARA